MKWLATGIAAFAIAFSTGAQAQKPEQTKVRLAVGGKSSLYYLPLTITERLGYFKDAGLDVEISDFAGGAKSLQALIGGSADVVTGSFDHTIQMQAKNQQIVAVVQLGRFPGFGLALRKEKAANYKGPKDLKGMKIGVTALFVEAIKANHDAYSPDGRFLKNGPETALKVLKAFDPNVQNAPIDLAKTYTEKFVEAAQAGH